MRRMIIEMHCWAVTCGQPGLSIRPAERVGPLQFALFSAGTSCNLQSRGRGVGRMPFRSAASILMTTQGQGQRQTRHGLSGGSMVCRKSQASNHSSALTIVRTRTCFDAQEGGSGLGPEFHSRQAGGYQAKLTRGQGKRGLAVRDGQRPAHDAEDVHPALSQSEGRAGIELPGFDRE